MAPQSRPRKPIEIALGRPVTRWSAVPCFAAGRCEFFSLRRQHGKVRPAGVEQILSGWAARGKRSGQVRCKGRRCIARESVPYVACGWREGASSFSPLPHRSGERIVDNLHGERSESRAAAGVCLGTGCGSCKITKCFARGRPEGKHGLPS